MDTTTESADGPLDGVRVIDLSTVVMGPYAAQILGDLGADVIKIESPADTVRVGPATAPRPGMTPLNLNVNRNKRSVALNLKDEADRERALELIDTADVLITNMRPGALARLGLTYADLAARHPGLVYAHAQGFRSDSDRAGHAAYDETVQASSGLVDIAHRALGEPVYLPTIIGDKVSALTIAYSVLAALVHRDSTGQGQHIEIPMTDTLIAFNLVEHLAGHVYEPAEGPTGFPLSMKQGPPGRAHQGRPGLRRSRTTRRTSVTSSPPPAAPTSPRTRGSTGAGHRRRRPRGPGRSWWRGAPRR